MEWCQKELMDPPPAWAPFPCPKNASGNLWGACVKDEVIEWSQVAFIRLASRVSTWDSLNIQSEHYPGEFLKLPLKYSLWGFIIQPCKVFLRHIKVWEPRRYTEERSKSNVYMQMSAHLNHSAFWVINQFLIKKRNRWEIMKCVCVFFFHLQCFPWSMVILSLYNFSRCCQVCCCVD